VLIEKQKNLNINKHSAAIQALLNPPKIVKLPKEKEESEEEETKTGLEILSRMEVAAKQLVDIGITDIFLHVVERIKYPADYDTLYLTVEKKKILIVNVVEKVNIKFDINMKEAYRGMMQHLELANAPIYRLGDVYKIHTGEDAIEITLNGQHVIGYYLLNKGSLVVGNWLWHEQYINVIVRNIWPQIKEKLYL